MIRRRLGASAVLISALCCWNPAGAELVLLVGGGVLKVDGFHQTGDQMNLLLPSGGTLTVSVLRIDRILADEIAEEPSGPLPADSLTIAFADDQSVPTTPFGELIYQTARRHGINPQLVAAMVWAESAFDPGAVSPKGASGLLQLMPSTAQRFGLSQKDVFEPSSNLDAGVRYIRWLSEHFAGNVPLVLAGYNAGESAVDRYEGLPPYRETRDYIRRIYSSVGLDSPLSGSE